MEQKTTQIKVFLFAGQGNPIVGMGADLWDIDETTRKIWDCASDISKLDIRRLCAKGPMVKLTQTICQQVAVTAINVTLFKLFCDRFELNDSVKFCGHSVGEYTALYAANTINLEDLFKLISFRSQLMQELSQLDKGTMVAVKGIDYSGLSQLIQQSSIEVDISCDNSRNQQVIGGKTSSLTEFSRLLMNNGLQSSKLGVSGAWHTRLMSEGVQRMRNYLAEIDIRPPNSDIIMNVPGAVERNPTLIRENLSLHLTHTVKWTDSMNYLLQDIHHPLFIEVSNKPYLCHLLQDNPRFIPSMSLHCKNI